MEIFELRYFRETALHENIHRASEVLGISPPSVSKAIQRLENELGVKLFRRKGRNIVLTPSGSELQEYANQLLSLEENARIAVGKSDTAPRVEIAAPDILQVGFGKTLSEEILREKENAELVFKTMPESDAIQMVRAGNLNYALSTRPAPSDLESLELADIEFVTVAGKDHPLFQHMESPGAKISITEILKYPFVVPEAALFGHVSNQVSPDGWRDDVYRREIRYRSDSLFILQMLVEGGRALAYVPTYYASAFDNIVLNIHDCPYTCRQKVTLVARNSPETTWQMRLWDALGHN